MAIGFDNKKQIRERTEKSECVKSQKTVLKAVQEKYKDLGVYLK